MLKNISKKIFSIFICLLIFNLSVNGNVRPGIAANNKQAAISIGIGQFSSFLSFILGIDNVEESGSEENDTSNARSQLSEEETAHLFIQTFHLTLSILSTEKDFTKKEKNSILQSHIPEVTPPPPKA